MTKIQHRYDPDNEQHAYLITVRANHPEFDAKIVCATAEITADTLAYEYNLPDMIGWIKDPYTGIELIHDGGLEIEVLEVLPVGLRLLPKRRGE